jgi:RNA polymerase sigma factor (sigma-70 family)
LTKVNPKSFAVTIIRVMEDLSDRELLECILLGNPNGLRELFRREVGYLHQLVRKILNAPDEIEQVLQEAYWTLWINPTRVKRVSAGSPTRELHRLVQQIAYRIRYNSRPKLVSLELLEIDPESISQENRITDRVDIDRLLGVLNVEEHELINLYGYNGMSVQEISVYMGIPLGTVKTRIRAAKKRIQNFAKRIGYEP